MKLLVKFFITDGTHHLKNTQLVSYFLKLRAHKKLFALKNIIQQWISSWWSRKRSKLRQLRGTLWTFFLRDSQSCKRRKQEWCIKKHFCLRKYQVNFIHPKLFFFFVHKFNAPDFDKDREFAFNKFISIILNKNVPFLFPRTFIQMRLILCYVY